MASYSHIYPYIQPIGTQEVFKTSSKCIYTQEAGLHYTNLMQL